MKIDELKNVPATPFQAEAIVERNLVSRGGSITKKDAPFWKEQIVRHWNYALAHKVISNHVSFSDAVRIAGE